MNGQRAAVARTAAAAAVALGFAALAGRAASAGTPAAAPGAERVPLAARTLLTALASAGTRLVAVGDRGVIVYSDDGGSLWTQALAVPTQALLTGVCFADARHGIAVGHDQVILTSINAGATWQLVHEDPGAAGPLLDVWCAADGHAIAVGAYSAYFESGDGGAHWKAVPFRPAPAAGHGARAAGADGATDERSDYHLNRIVAGDGPRRYIAAEAGHLYRSDDGGGSWSTLSSPYSGSFFGVLPLGGDALLAYGLRGHLYRSGDAGASWQAIASGVLSMLDGGARLPEGGVALVGLAGTVLVSRDDGRSFALVQQADHAGLAAVAAQGAGRIVVAGEGGVRRIELPVNAAGASAGAQPPAGAR